MDQAAARGLRQQSVHLFNHFKKEIDRDNSSNKALYDPLSVLAEATAQKRSTVPFVTETLYGIEGLMSKLQVMISLHIDVGLREISKNLRLMCKEQADLMDKILVEARASLWFYVFSLNSIYNVLKNQHTEKQIYAEKAYRLALTVKELTHINEKTAKDETILQMLEELYPDEDKKVGPSSEQEILASDASDKQKAGAIKKLNAQQKQLMVDSEIQMAIELIENNPQLSAEDKEYRKSELMKSRRSGGGMVGTDARLSAKYGSAGGFVETIFAPGIGFIERVSAKKLERWIRELKVELVRAKEHEMTDAEKAYAEMERIKKSMDEQLAERKLARSNYAAHTIQKKYRAILFDRRVHRRFLKVRAVRIQRAWVKYNTIRRMRWGVRRIILENWASRVITRFAKHMQRVRQSRIVRNIVLRQSILREEYQMAKQKLRLTRLEQLLVELYPKEVSQRMTAELTTSITTKYGHQSHYPNLSVKALAGQPLQTRTAYLRTTSNYIKSRLIETEKDADALEVTRKSMQRVSELSAGDMLSGSVDDRKYARFKEKFTSAATAAEALDEVEVDQRLLREGPPAIDGGQVRRADVSVLFRKLELMDKNMLSFSKTVREADRKGLRQVKLGRELMDQLEGLDPSGPAPSRPVTAGGIARPHSCGRPGARVSGAQGAGVAAGPESVPSNALTTVVGAVLPHFNPVYSDRHSVDQLLMRYSGEPDKSWLEQQSTELLHHMTVLLVQQGLLFYPDLDAFRNTNSNADIVPLLSPLTSVLSSIQALKKLSSADTGQLSLECDHWSIPILQSDINYLTSHALYNATPLSVLGSSTCAVPGRENTSESRALARRNGSARDSLNNASAVRRTVRARVKDSFLLGLTTVKKIPLLVRLFLTVAKHSVSVTQAGGVVGYVAQLCAGLFACARSDVWVGPPACKLMFAVLFGLESVPSSGERFLFPRSTVSGAVVRHEARWGTNCLFSLYICQLAQLLKTKMPISKGAAAAKRVAAAPRVPLPADTVSLQTAVNIVQYCCCQLPEAKWKPVTSILLKLELYSPVVQCLLGTVFQTCGLDLEREVAAALSAEEKETKRKRDERIALGAAAAALRASDGEDDDSGAGVERDDDDSELEIDSVDSDAMLQRPRPPSASELQSSSKQRAALQRQRWMVQEKQLAAEPAGPAARPQRRTDDSSEYSSLKLQHARHHLPNRAVTGGELELDLLLANAGRGARARSAPGLRSPKKGRGPAPPCSDLEGAVVSIHALALALLPYHVEQSARAYREFCLNSMFRSAAGRVALSAVGAPLTADVAPAVALSAAPVSRDRFVEYVEEELVFDVRGEAGTLLAAFGLDGKEMAPPALQPETYSPDVLLEAYDASVLKFGDTEMNYISFVHAMLNIIQSEPT